MVRLRLKYRSGPKKKFRTTSNDLKRPQTTSDDLRRHRKKLFFRVLPDFPQKGKGCCNRKNWKNMATKKIPKWPQAAIKGWMQPPSGWGDTVPILDWGMIAANKNLSKTEDCLKFWAEIRGCDDIRVSSMVVISATNIKFLSTEPGLRDTNRPRAPSAINKKLKILETGLWDPEAGEFCYNKTGKLYNGFTRSQAIEKWGEKLGTDAAVLVMMRGPCSKGAENATDTATPRTLAAQFGIMCKVSAEDKPQVATVATLIIRHYLLGEDRPLHPMPMTELEPLFEPLKGFYKNLIRPIRRRTTIEKYMWEPALVAGFMYALHHTVVVLKEDPQWIYDLWDRLRVKTGLVENSALYRLLNEITLALGSLTNIKEKKTDVPAKVRTAIVRQTLFVKTLWAIHLYRLNLDAPCGKYDKRTGAGVFDDPVYLQLVNRGTP